jgi:hypothetical protein
MRRLAAKSSASRWLQKAHASMQETAGQELMLIFSVLLKIQHRLYLWHEKMARDPYDQARAK